jgi:hypothetical protein
MAQGEAASEHFPNQSTLYTLLNMNSLCEVASTAMSSEETPNSRFDLGTYQKALQIWPVALLALLALLASAR